MLAEAEPGAGAGAGLTDREDKGRRIQLEVRSGPWAGRGAAERGWRAGEV